MLFIACVGVLIAMSFGTVQETKQHVANLETCRENLTAISKAVEDYEKRNGGKLPEHLSDLTTGPNPPIKELPKCPEAGKKPSYDAASAYEFRNGAVPRFTVRCAGTNHSVLGLKKDEPYYDSLYGIKPAPSSETLAP